MPSYSTPSALGIVYSVVSRLNEDTAKGSNKAARELTQFIQDTFGVPAGEIEQVKRDANSDIEGLSIRLVSGHRVVVLDKTEMENACEALAPQSITFEGEKFIGFIDQPKERGQSIFWGNAPDFVEGSLVVGKLSDVILHIRASFENGIIGN